MAVGGLIAIVAATAAFFFYVPAGEDDDMAALTAARTDQRQKLLSLQVALAFNITALAAFTGLTVAVAIRADWWWPFAVILGITGCVPQGLLTCGVAEGQPMTRTTARPVNPRGKPLTLLP